MKAIYENNYIKVREMGIHAGFPDGPKTVVRYNTITGNKDHLFGGYYADSVWIYNNLFYNTVYTPNQAIIVGDLTYIIIMCFIHFRRIIKKSGNSI